MESTFNPTRKDLLNVEGKIIQLKAEKQKLITSKLTIEGSLQIMKNKYNEVEFGSPEFLKIKQERSVLKEEHGRVELEIKKLNQEIIFKSQLRNEIEFTLKGKKYNEMVDSGVVKQLVALKEKYNSFSKDRTRVSSMRIMSAEISQEIEKILNGINF